MDPAFRFPSAVNRRRLHVPQNCSDIEVMNPTWARFDIIVSHMRSENPTWPRKPGTFHPLDVSFGASSTRWNEGKDFLMISNISCGSKYVQTLYHVIVQSLTDLIGHHLIRVPTVAVERHVLDETDIDVAERRRNCLCIWIQSLVRIILRWGVIDSLVPGFLNKIDDLVFVQAPHDHTVHLATLVTRRILSFEKLLWTKKAKYKYKLLYGLPKRHLDRLEAKLETCVDCFHYLRK